MKNFFNMTISFIGLALVMMAFSNSQNRFDKIQVREFELIDESGKKRVSIKVEEGGEVLFRMMDDNGTIRVKMGADEKGSGLVLLDSRTEPGIHILSKEKGGSVTLMDSHGKKRAF